MAKTRADLDAAIAGQTSEIKALTTAVGGLIDANKALVAEIQNQGATEDFSDEVQKVTDATAAAEAALTNVQAQTAADTSAGQPASPPAADPGLTPPTVGNGGTTGGAP